MNQYALNIYMFFQQKEIESDFNPFPHVRCFWSFLSSFTNIGATKCGLKPRDCFVCVCVFAPFYFDSEIFCLAIVSNFTLL